MHECVVRVTQYGLICMARRKINPSTVFTGQLVAVREEADDVGLVSFVDDDFGFFDRETNRVKQV